MKKSKLLLGIALASFLFINPLNASENEIVYVNNHGVKFTETQYNKLKNSGMNEYFIADLSQEMANQYIDVKPEDIKVTSETKYYKVIETIENNKVVSTKTIEETEADYLRAEKMNLEGMCEYEENSYEPYASSATHTTSHKKITLSVASSGASIDAYQVNLTNVWLQNPVVRSFDVLGFKLPSKAYILTGNSGQLVGSQTSSAGTTSYDSSVSNTNFKYTANSGVGLSQNLHNNGTNIVNSITANVFGRYGDTIGGAYEHATSTVTLSQSQNYTFSTSGKGGVFNFSSSVWDKYDNTAGLQVTYSL